MVDWNAADWGGHVHEAAWCADRHDAAEAAAEAGRG